MTNYQIEVLKLVQVLFSSGGVNKHLLMTKRVPRTFFVTRVPRSSQGFHVVQKVEKH